MAWEYLEYDGAFFRKRADSGLISVDEVWDGSAWVPYQGDRFDRGSFGNRITEAELPQAAKS